MQQLESLGNMQHERTHQGQQGGHVTLQDMPPHFTFQDEDTPLRSLANVAEVAGRLESSATTETMNVSSAVSPTQAHATTPQTYYNAQFYRPPQGMQTTPLFDHTDLAAILDSEVWSGLQPNDASMQPNFGIFDYLSIPTAGPETAGFPILPLAFGSRPDGTFTDSVLNFHSTIDGGEGFPNS
jgi:hypothetical protein